MHDVREQELGVAPARPVLVEKHHDFGVGRESLNADPDLAQGQQRYTALVVAPAVGVAEAVAVVRQVRLELVLVITDKLEQR